MTHHELPSCIRWSSRTRNCWYIRAFHGNCASPPRYVQSNAFSWFIADACKVRSYAKNPRERYIVKKARYLEPRCCRGRQKTETKSSSCRPSSEEEQVTKKQKKGGNGQEQVVARRDDDETVGAQRAGIRGVLANVRTTRASIRMEFVNRDFNDATNTR